MYSFSNLKNLFCTLKNIISVGIYYRDSRRLVSEDGEAGGQSWKRTVDLEAAWFETIVRVAT